MSFNKSITNLLQNGFGIQVFPLPSISKSNSIKIETERGRATSNLL